MKLNHANSVPKVPGARGARPLPQPQAKKCAGWAKRNLRLGAPFEDSVKVVVASLRELDRLTVRVEDRHSAGLTFAHATDAPERQFETRSDSGDGLRPVSYTHLDVYKRQG